MKKLALNLTVLCLISLTVISCSRQGDGLTFETVQVGMSIDEVKSNINEEFEEVTIFATKGAELTTFLFSDGRELVFVNRKLDKIVSSQYDKKKEIEEMKAARKKQLEEEAQAKESK